MDARELVELAAVAATHGAVLITDSVRLSEAGMQEYWIASRCRFERWTAAWQQCSSPPNEAAAQRSPDAMRKLLALAEEILTGEVLARVWAVICTAHDAEHRCEEAGPLARSVLQAHQEARNRVLKLLVEPPPHAKEECRQLDLLRRRCERWTDVLLAHLLPHGDAKPFAFDAERIDDFAEGYREQQRAGVSQTCWEMTIGSLSASFQTPLAGPSPNPDLNAALVAGILACFPAGLLDPGGMRRVSYLTRMQSTTVDAQGMIDELIALDEARFTAEHPSR